MRLRLPWPCLLLLTALAGGATVLEAREVGGRSEAQVARRVGQVLRSGALRRGQQGVVVLTRGSRPGVVFAQDADLALVPASAAKLLTSAAALDLLGPSHRFVTRLTARGRSGAQGTLEGDLVLHGAGDPNLSGRFTSGGPLAVLDGLAAAVRAANVVRVTGALVLDERPLDDVYVHPDWSDADRRRWYGAAVGGLAFNDGCIDVLLAGTTQGKPATLTLPAGSGPWRVVNDAVTRGTEGSSAGGHWIDGGTRLRLQGTLGAGREASFHVPVPQPAPFLGSALLHVLGRHGVRVEGGQRLARDDADRMAGRLLAQHESALVPTLAVVNQNSQNFYASMLFKLCGAVHAGVGSWEGGDLAVRAMLARRRIPAGPGLVLRDGSGLSPNNRISAGLLAQVLAAFDEDILRGPLLFESLAVSGGVGTLRTRLAEDGVAGRVRAKTGTLNDTRARALAGYVDGRDGHPGYVFALLFNGAGASNEVLDKIVRELCR